MATTEDWPHKERRQDNIEFRIELMRKIDSIERENKYINESIKHLSERVEHTNTNNKQFKALLDEDINDIRTAIQGDDVRNIEGLSPKLSKIAEEFHSHVMQDRWCFGIVITVILSILGWTIFH